MSRESCDVHTFVDGISTHAQFSPTQSNIFAVSNTLGEIHLHDRRKAPLFSSMSEQAMDASRSAAVVRYVTGLSPRRFPRTIHRPEATSLAFSPDGALLAAQVSQSWPTLFAVGDPQPLAVLSAEGFSDNSTIKVSHDRRGHIVSANQSDGSTGRFTDLLTMFTMLPGPTIELHTLGSCPLYRICGKRGTLSHTTLRQCDMSSMT